MSTVIYEMDLADRLARTLRVLGISRSEMADVLGVSPNTVSNYTGGRTVPGKSELTVWAMRCGITREWLETGERPYDGPDDGGEFSPNNPCYSVRVVRFAGASRISAA